MWFLSSIHKILVNGVDKRLKEIIIKLPKLGCKSGAMMPNHVHLLCEVELLFGVHKFVKRVKGRSSRVLRNEFPRLKSRLPTLCTHSYFVSSMGGTPIAVSKQYIEN
jgi:putative transposase